MWHIILQILAIIGFVLLGILALVILLLLWILLSPIRYKLYGIRNEEGMRFSVRASYLLYILSFRYDYPKGDDDFGMDFRLFGQSLLKEDSIWNRLLKKFKKDDSDTSTGRNKTKKKTKEDKKSEIQEDIDADMAEPIDEDVAAPGESDSVEQEEPKKTFFEKISFQIKKIYDKIKEAIQKFIRKMRTLYERFTFYREFLLQPANTRMYGRVMMRIRKILKIVLPRKTVGFLHVGTGSPDTTGYLCGFYGAFCNRFGKKFRFIPDFEEKALEFEITTRGSFNLLQILIQAISIIADKQVRRFLDEIKQED